MTGRFFARFSFLLFMVLFMAFGCNVEKSCNENRLSFLQFSFHKVYTSVGNRQMVKDSLLSKLAVSWPGYIMDTVRVSSVTLPLSLNSDTSEFEFYLNDTSAGNVQVIYARSQIFINYECGFRTDFTLDTLVSSLNNIDSIQIIRPVVTDADEKHIKIFLHTPSATSTPE